MQFVDGAQGGWGGGGGGGRDVKALSALQFIASVRAQPPHVAGCSSAVPRGISNVMS